MNKMKKLSTQAAAAKLIRDYLREHNIPGQVKSRSFSGGSSVDVYAEDLPPETYKALNDYARQFQYGHFDGMIDLYEYSNTRDDIPQVKFVFVNNYISAAMRQSIWDFLRGYYSGMDTAPSDANMAGNFAMHGDYGDRVISRFFSGNYSNTQYWDFLRTAQEVTT